MIQFFIPFIFAICVVSIVLILLDLKRVPSSATQRRLEKIKNKSFDVPDPTLQKGLSVIALDTEYRIKSLGVLIRNFSFAEKIKQLLMLADSNLQIDTFLLLSILCAVPFTLVMIIVSPIYFPLGLLFAVIPTAFLKYQTYKRNIAFTQQFPDALNMISSSLRAGHPLLTSFEIVHAEMPKPVSQVFRTAMDDISLGTDTKDALNNMIKIMPQNVDLKFFITAVLIQREVGGNLAELLDTLSDTIRERFKLLGQLKSQTAQTRFSGMILCVVPPVIAVAIFIINPEYMSPLLHTVQGRTALLLACFLIVAGLYSIVKITNIEI